MMTTPDPSHVVAAEAAIARALKPIQQFVRGWMMGPEVDQLADRLGMRSGNDVWIVGRAGVLGDSDADVAAAGLGFLSRAGVRAAWDALPPGVTPRDVAQEYAGICAAWGADVLGAFDQVRIARLHELGRRLANAADGALGPVFAGWRAMPQPADLGARCALTMHVLRELRGGAHIAAVFGCGLTPLEAVLASPAAPPRSGPGWAEHLKWAGPFTDVTDEMRAARLQAEALTSRMLLPAYLTLSEAELAEFAELAETTRNAINM